MLTSIIFNIAHLASGHEALAVPNPEAFRRELSGQNVSHLLTTPLYGTISDEAYYYMNVFVGNPPQKQSVILDTGSSVLAFPCSGCKSCGKHLNAPFNVDDSMTARWLGCHDRLCLSDRCSANRQDPSFSHCDYYQSYSEGSSIGGHYFSDWISVTAYRNETNELNDPVNFETQLTSRFDHIGCHEIETKLFVGQTANGIIGIAFPHKNQPTAVDALFHSSRRYEDKAEDQEDIPHKIFSICISDEGGVMTIGGYDPAYVNSKNNYIIQGRRTQAVGQSAKMTMKTLFDDPNITRSIIVTKFSSSKSYNIGARKMSATSSDDSNYQIPLAGSFGNATIVDSGTTYSYLTPKLYQSMMSHLTDSCLRIDGCVPANPLIGSELCYRSSASDVSLDNLDKLFPTFYIKTEDGSNIPWEPRSYFYSKRDSNNTWCLAIENNHMQETVLGMSFIKNRMAIFDRENMMFGVTRGNCPSTTDKTRDNQSPPVFDAGGVKDKLKSYVVPEKEPKKVNFANLAIPESKSALWEHYYRAKDLLGMATGWEFVAVPITGLTIIGGLIMVYAIRKKRSIYTVQTDGDIRLAEVAPQERPLTPQSSRV